jgi:excisionase family DNA binding protein
MDELTLLRPAEAARELGISLRQLRRLAAIGHLVTVRTLGGHRRYRSDDVGAFERWRSVSRAETSKAKRQPRLV